MHFELPFDDESRPCVGGSLANKEASTVICCDGGEGWMELVAKVDMLGRLSYSPGTFFVGVKAYVA